MAGRSGSVFVCQNCGAQSPKWAGRCSECGTWNTLIEEIQSKSSAGTKARDRVAEAAGLAKAGQAEPLFHHSQMAASTGARVASGFAELDRVLGGGFVEGSLLLFGGEPGIGKSTLLLQLLGSLSSRGISTLYVSGEESAAQVAARAKRMDIKSDDHLHFLPTTDLDEALKGFEKLKPQVAVVDSIQTLSSADFDSVAGTVSQVRAATHALMELAKTTGTIVLLVGHVTKEGTVAGPKLLEHMVDGVFYFELATSSGYRLVRGQKNRFGGTHEVAVFEMSPKGLLQIDNPSARFLAERAKGMVGSSVVAQLAGTRPFLTEFQAIVQRCFQGYPRRTVQGVDQNRIAVLLAVAEKCLGVIFSDQDVYCKVASGDRIEEPGADLALLMALVSSLVEKPIPADLILIGEVGLGGEVRSVPALAARLSEAKSVGITRAIVPSWHLKEAAEVKGVEVIGVKTLGEVHRLCWT